MFRVEQVGQVILQQVADALDADIGCGIAGERFRIGRVVTLPDENGANTRAPEFFARGQDSQFIVDQHVMFSRVALLDILEFLLLVHVNQHATGDRGG